MVLRRPGLTYLLLLGCRSSATGGMVVGDWVGEKKTGTRQGFRGRAVYSVPKFKGPLCLAAGPLVNENEISETSLARGGGRRRPRILACFLTCGCNVAKA